MNNSYFSTLLVIFLLFLFSTNLISQDNWWRDKKYNTEYARTKYSKCKRVFVEAGDGLNHGNVYSLSPHFKSEVYLNITGEDKGYYSSDQTKFIIENFLTNYPVDSFKWRNSSRSMSYAFATGKFVYKKDGYSSSFEISISLNYVIDQWLIDQIIIN